MKLFLKITMLILFIIVPLGFGSLESGKKLNWLQSDIVELTVYNKGHQTASGMILDHKNPKKHNIIAISRDLLKLFKFDEIPDFLSTWIFAVNPLFTH